MSLFPFIPFSEISVAGEGGEVHGRGSYLPTQSAYEKGRKKNPKRECI